MKPLQQRGVALITAILVAALVAISAVGILDKTAFFLEVVSRQSELTQAASLARAGTDYAKAVLREDDRTSKIDSPDEEWAKRLPPFSVDGGELEGYVMDAQGKFNLNNLVTQEGKIHEGILDDYRRLLSILDLPVWLADTLADWIDEDDISRSGGAESASYRTRSKPYQAANRPLSHLGELRLIQGYTPEIIKTLNEHVTVLPGIQAINVNTTTAEVLSAVLPGLSVTEARQLLFPDNGNWYKNGMDFRRRLGRDDLPSNETPLMGESRYFVIVTKARFGSTETTLETLVERPSGQGIPRTLWQTSL